MTFTPIRTLSARATCWSVVDCGAQVWFFEERPRRVREIRLGFELLDETGRNGDRIAIEARYHLSFWPTANFKRDLEAWLGRSLTLAERAGGFDFSQLIHRALRLDLLTRDRYRAIVGLRPPVGPEIWPANRTPILLSLASDAAFDVEAFHRLSDRLRQRVSASPTFHALHLPDAELWPPEHVREPTPSEIIGGDEVPW